jgi:Xaa-Pro dipeptidase
MVELKDLYRSHIDALTQNSQAALEQAGYEQLVIHSGKLVRKSSFDDQDFPLRTVPMFEWFSDLQWSDSVIILGKNRAPELLALRDNSFWERPVEPDWDIIRAGLEVTEVQSSDAIKDKIEGHSKTAFIGHQSSALESIGANSDNLNPEQLVELLHDHRAIKSAYEIECLAEASRIAVQGHKATERAFKEGMRSELGIHLEYLKATHQDDAQTPYKNIVALGDAAAILHHMHYRDVPEAKSLLVDAGASSRRYHSDITRSYVADDTDEATALFCNILDQMEKLQLRLCARVKVDDFYEDLHNYANEQIGQILIDTQVLKCGLEEAVQTDTTRKFFPHGLGHSLGLQVHDVGCLKRAPKERNKWLRNTTQMAAGQVFTIEPGLYFIDTLLEELKGSAQSSFVDWAKIDLLRPFGGIRIEDNIVVLPEDAEKNFRNLTREAFAES